MNRILAIFMIMTAAVAAFADDAVKTVTGTSTFYAEPSHSLVQAKRLALEQARLDALAREFGTNVSQDTYSASKVQGRNESNYFQVNSLTEVNGEWIADEGDPKYDVKLDENDCFIVTCTIRGKAKRISNESADFKALVLRNGNEERFADTNFRVGDDLKLLVRTPQDGYLLFYLMGEDGQVYSLLPYSSATGGALKLRRDTDYVFFDRAKADPVFGSPDELQLNIEKNRPMERNSCYVIFSPNPFNKAVDQNSDGYNPRQLSREDFHRWLTAIRKRDPKMGMKTINITINR